MSCVLCGITGMYVIMMQVVDMLLYNIVCVIIYTV